MIIGFVLIIASKCLCVKRKLSDLDALRFCRGGSSLLAMMGVKRLCICRTFNAMPGDEVLCIIISSMLSFLTLRLLQRHRHLYSPIRF